MGGILHADDLLHTAKTAKELDQLGLLQVELFIIGEVLEGAASALFRVGAGEHGWFLSLCHVFNQSVPK
jgi:hypothetical protein